MLTIAVKSQYAESIPGELKEFGRKRTYGLNGPLLNPNSPSQRALWNFGS